MTLCWIKSSKDMLHPCSPAPPFLYAKCVHKRKFTLSDRSALCFSHSTLSHLLFHAVDGLLFSEMVGPTSNGSACLVSCADRWQIKGIIWIMKEKQRLRLPLRVPWVTEEWLNACVRFVGQRSPPSSWEAPSKGFHWNSVCSRDNPS